MRFRPVFPLLARDVPRETEFESGARRNPTCPAGSSVGLMSIAALFDGRGVPDVGAYRGDRAVGGVPPPWQTFMFGFGDRRCPAQEPAVAILGSALIGLLRLPRLRWADAWPRRIGYDGPMICRMNLCAA